MAEAFSTDKETRFASKKKRLAVLFSEPHLVLKETNKKILRLRKTKVQKIQKEH